MCGRSLAYGFEGSTGLKDHAQLVLHARYRNGEHVSTSAPAAGSAVPSLRQNSTALGGMLRFGLPSFNGDFEGLFTRTDLQHKRDDGYRVSFGVERQLTQDLWLNLSWARNSSDQLSTLSRNSILGALKWTFNSKPTMQLAP